MTTRTPIVFLLALTLTLVVGAQQPTTPVPPVPPPTPGASDASPHPPAPYIRATDQDNGARVQLQTAARLFRSAEPGAPEIHLVGAVHIGEKSFYDELQTYLDAHDVVLFEGVKPPGAGAHDPGLSPEATDEQRADLTKKRVRLAATLIEVYKRDNARLPQTLADLENMTDKRVSYLATIATRDAWGRLLAFTPDAGAGTYSLASLAADGLPGGEGPNADIAYADLEPINADDLPGAGKGIQSQLADAFGLVFQLDNMDHARPHWRNSDMSIDQVQARMEETGADGSQLFRMLDGSSMQAKLAGFVLKLIGASPTLQTMSKVILIDTLGRAEELMAAMPGDMGKMMSVIIDDRNQVVIDDLKELLAQSASGATPKSIGIIYGAGHLADLERRLVAMGFKPVEDKWFTAIDVDVTAGGAMSVDQARSMRQMMSRAMAAQVENARKQAERDQRRAERRKQREAQKQPQPAEPAPEPR